MQVTRNVIGVVCPLFIFASHDPQLISHAEETYIIRDGKLVDHSTGQAS